MYISSTVLALLPLALATHLRVGIIPHASLPNPSTLPPSTIATLTTLGQSHSAILRTDNTFDFRNVTTGSYLFDVHCHTHVFAPLRVDIHEGVKKQQQGDENELKEVMVWGTFRGNEWSNKGEAVQVREEWEVVKHIWAFDVRVLGTKEYLIERQGFSPLSILKNPMILLAGVSMILVFGMPYLMENMDPEMRAEFEERQKAGPATSATANSLQNFDAAAWLAGKSTSGSSTPRGIEPVEKGITR